MSRKNPASRPPEGEATEPSAAIDRLANELKTVWQAIDEVRDAIDWAARNPPEAPVPVPYRITSMPLDPAAADWSERLNRFSAADLPAEIGPDCRPDGAPPQSLAVETSVNTPQDRRPARQAEIAEVEPATYCCDAPELQWCGDPDRPGVYCARCGFIVADEGSIVCWRDDDADPAEEARQRQAPAIPAQGVLWDDASDVV